MCIRDRVWHSLNLLWTDFMHEVDSAKAKLVVPEHYLRNNGPGRGMSYEWWRDVYTKPQSASADAEETIDRIQFDMRVQEYLDAISGHPPTRRVVCWLVEHHLWFGER